MTFVVLMLVLCLALATALWWVARSHQSQIAQLDELPACTRPVDMAAFQNLIDPAETQFLRQSLPPMQFRIVQRERTLASAEYVRHILHNSVVLIQLGQLARENPNPQLVEAARAMIDRAGHVRIMATFALVKLYVISVVPGLPFTAEDIFRDYRNLTEAAVLFTRLQRPAFAGRVSAVL